MQVGSPALALLVLALPFASFLLIGLLRPLRRAGRPAALVGPFAVAFELLGVLLVVALLGALYFARTED